MIQFVSLKLKAIRGGVPETFIWEGEKEEDGNITYDKFLDMLAYFKVTLNSIEKSALLKELDEEQILIKLKNQTWVNPKQLLKVLKIPLPGDKDVPKLSLQKKRTIQVKDNSDLDHE